MSVFSVDKQFCDNTFYAHLCNCLGLPWRNFKMTGKRKAGGRCCAGSSLRAPAPAEHLVAIENSLEQPVVFMGWFTHLPISGWISQGNSKDTTSQPASCATHFKKKGRPWGTALQQERLWLSLLRRLLVFSAKAWNSSQAKAPRMKDELKLMKSVGPKNKIWFVLKPSERTWSTCKKPSCSQNLFIGCLQPQYFPFSAWNFDLLPWYFPRYRCWSSFGRESRGRESEKKTLSTYQGCRLQQRVAYSGRHDMTCVDFFKQTLWEL